jgi:hypothetical protein
MVNVAGASHILTVKWFVPDTGKVIGNGLTPSVERTRDWIAFFFLFLGSFM